MNEILNFISNTFYEDREPEEHTIEGERFRDLMDLCFAHADRFSLHRNNWPESNDGALEQALRPFCLGEYRSYAAIGVSYDEQVWEKCFLYPAAEETKAILLRCIPHLFGREPDLAPEGHREYLQKKYAPHDAAWDAAWEKIDSWWEDFRSRTGRSPSDEEFASFEREARREADAIGRQIFDPKDYYSTMDDPCFFRGDEMFFETVTHERDCFAHAFSDRFGERLRALGEWVDISDRCHPPLFSLKKAKDLVLY